MKRARPTASGKFQTERHRSHDYRNLIARWRAVAKKADLVMAPWVTVSGYRIYVLRSKGRARPGGIYLSAGIHGDEPAGTEGLITWAEQNTATLRKMPVMIFPCLSPWGLVNNSRLDSDGRDLNRMFRDTSFEFVAKWTALMEGRVFDVALCLHEDYDGQGCYLYEPLVGPPHWGEELVALAPPCVPVESRREIDGRKAARGVVRVELRPDDFPLLPEAARLHREHSRRSFTLETPSEFDLGKRVEVQMRVITEVCRRVTAGQIF